MDGHYSYRYPLVMFESQPILNGVPKGTVLGTLTLPYTVPNSSNTSVTPFFDALDMSSEDQKKLRFASIHTVQYMLQQMLISQETARNLIIQGMQLGGSMQILNIPIESIRYSLAVIGALPVFVLFPYIQRYYAKGITLGSTKG